MPPFKSWLRPSIDGVSGQSGDEVGAVLDVIRTAMTVDDAAGATGKWVGVLGFSQGAKLCASLLYTQQYCREPLAIEPPILPHFRFGILLAGRAPLAWLGGREDAPDGVANDATTSASSNTDAAYMSEHERLIVPTLHVHGLRDPGLDLHRQLKDLCCRPDSARVLEWDGAHAVPLKSVDVRLLTDAITAIAKDAGVSIEQRV